MNLKELVFGFFFSSGGPMSEAWGAARWFAGETLLAKRLP
jgi:hypothetical protein